MREPVFTGACSAIIDVYKRQLKDDAGNTYSYVDEEMRNRLQVRLITCLLYTSRCV